MVQRRRQHGRNARNDGERRSGHADRWPPMVLTLDLYRAAEEDDIPKKWRNLARHARKKRTKKKWKNKIRRRIKQQQKGGRRHGRNGND